MSGELEAANLKYLALQPAQEGKGASKATEFALYYYKTFKQKTQDLHIYCPKTYIMVHTYDDIYIIIYRQRNVLLKPQWSHLIPTSFHRQKPHREGQGNLESDP